MREAGDVCYADTYKDGTGMVEFLRYEDMKYAIKKLDDSRFRSHEVHLTLTVVSLSCVLYEIHLTGRSSLRSCQRRHRRW